MGFALCQSPLSPEGLLLGDALKLLPELPSESVDLVLTDPPYFLSGLDDAWVGGRWRPWGPSWCPWGMRGMSTAFPRPCPLRTCKEG